MCTKFSASDLMTISAHPAIRRPVSPIVSFVGVQNHHVHSRLGSRPVRDCTSILSATELPVEHVVDIHQRNELTADFECVPAVNRDDLSMRHRNDFPHAVDRHGKHPVPQTKQQAADDRQRQRQPDCESSSPLQGRVELESCR